MSIKEFYGKYKIEIALWAMAGFALFASIFIFLPQSLRLDEAQSLWQTSRSPAKIFNILAQDVHVPLYHIILHYWQVLFGNNVATVRVFSLIFFLISIPAIYRLGKLAYGKKEGLFAALLLSISPFMNWYGNEVRMYSLFTFLCIVNQYYFISLFKVPNNAKRKKYWIWYAVTALLGIFTHYFFFFALITQALFYLFNRQMFHKEDFKKFIRVAVLLFIAFAPWIIYVISLGTASNSSPMLGVPTSIDIFNTFSQFMFGFQTDAVNTMLLSLWPIVVLFGFLGLRKKEAIKHETLYLIAALTIPIVLALVVSMIVRPLYLSRYLILSLPPLYLLISSFVHGLPQKLARVIGLAIVVVMVGMLLVQAASSLTPVKENYREATDYLEEHANAADVIVVSAPFTIYPVEYYYDGAATLYTLPIWDRSEYGPIPPYNENTIAGEVTKITEGQRNLWLLLSYDQGYEDDILMYFDTRYHRLSTKNFSSGMNLYEYKIRYP